MLIVVFGGELRPESPPFKSYTTEEGLAHDNVNKIVRDSRGFLWFCTAEGLSRFDGSRFTNFTTDQGLPHRDVNELFETKDGTYLIGTAGGLVVFDPYGKPYRWNVPEGRLELTSEEPPMFRTYAPNGPMRQSKIIYSIAELDNGTFLIGTAFGLYRGEWEDGGIRFEEIEVPNGVAAGYYALLKDGQGGVIATTSHGIFRILDGRVDLLDRVGAHSIIQTSDGRFWVGASGAPTGIRIYELTNGSLSLVERYTTKDGLVGDTFHYAICQMPDGKIYVGLGNGFQEFVPGSDGRRGTFRTITNDIVITLAQDPSGNLWLGTELKGAWQLPRSGFVTFGEKDGIEEAEDIRAIYVDRDGEIYLPTRPHGVLHLLQNGKFERIYPKGVVQRSWGWSHLDLRSIDDEWWVPDGDGLRRYPKVTRYSDLAFTSPKKIYTKNDGLNGNEIFILFEDSRGDVWITTYGGVNPNTLSRWERSTDTITAFTGKDGLPENNGAVAYAEDWAGNVWFGFFFGSVVRYRNGRFDRFTVKDGMPESMASALYADSSGKLWIGTSGQGLYRVDDPNADVPTFTNVSTRDGLASNQVICLTEDRFGQLYAGTGRGINRIDPKGNIDVFTQADGLPSNYVTRCAADKNGSLWFVSRSTLVRYKPEPKIAAAPQTVYIDKISVNGVPQKISALGETEITLPDLTHDQTQLQINYFAITFGLGENIRFQYSLDEQDWSEPTDQGTINLNLAPASHAFRVRAVGAGGVTSQRAAVLNVTVLQPIWARGWFVALSAVAAAAIILGVFYYRTENLRRINAALLEANRAEEALRRSRDERVAELEQVRSRIATDLHDDIGSSLTQIAVLSEVAQTQTGKANGQPEVLRKITDVTNELVGTMSDIVWAINPAKDHFSDLTQRMRRVAADLLSPKGIAVHFRSREEDKDLRIKTNERREVFLIFKESVNNIAKHSGAKNVDIDLEINDDVLILRIGDDGDGFPGGPPSFEDTFSSERQGGNGIRNMRKRASEIGGRFDIDSAPGRGTTTYLALPVDPSHSAET